MLQFDQELFFFINHTLHFGALNKLMPYWRSMYFWLPLYIFFTSYLLYNFGKTGAIYILALALTVGIADVTSSRIIKNTVQRARPCNDIMIQKNVKLLVPCGGGYSFPSSHATNHFAAAVFVIFTFVEKRRWLKWSLIAWAASIAFGQVYVGVHYPFDVICGAILGSSIGWLGAFVYKKMLGNANKIV
jgi:undecaprenyl-diphosphatase